MQTTLVEEMLLPRMRPDEGQLSVELAILRHIDVCSDVTMRLSRCERNSVVGGESVDLGGRRLIKKHM